MLGTWGEIICALRVMAADRVFRRNGAGQGQD